MAFGVLLLGLRLRSACAPPEMLGKRQLAQSLPDPACGRRPIQRATGNLRSVCLENAEGFEGVGEALCQML